MPTTKRKICVVTGSRAEYGLLWWTLNNLRSDAKIDLQLCVTGMHLSPEFGMTVRDIEKDGFKISRRIESLLSSDSAAAISKSMALGISGFADAFSDLKPDILLVVGDRFETFAAVVAALAFRIPVAHCHGGESTVGAIDEAMRHSITKMAHLHFVATPEYARRVIQLGEYPEKVFVSGALSVENIKRLKFLNRRELEESLGFKFKTRNFLVTFHPVTLENETAEAQFSQLLEALKIQRDTAIIFTKPNADTGGRSLIKMIDEFVKKYPDRAVSAASLGNLRYLSLLKYVDIVLGNSSSGLIEAPSFKTATINIGDRQKGRIRAASVVDVQASTADILRAIKRCLSADYQSKLKRVGNPYDHGLASSLIVKQLKSVKLTNLVKKPFFDLNN